MGRHFSWRPRSRRSGGSTGRRRLLAVGGFVTALVLFIPGAWFGAARLDPRAAAAGDPVIAAAGDIACDPASANFNSGNGNAAKQLCLQKQTYDLLTQINPTAVLALGDTQYYCGGYQAFQRSYALSWGNVKSKTYPVIGNHEILTSTGTGRTDCDPTGGAQGYFQYYGSAAGTAGQGWYSFDLGSWHLIALNSNCTQAGGCGPTSPEGKWLAADLAAHSGQCLLAYWHIPLNTSSIYASSNSYEFWNQLAAAHADVILNGHAHDYERFAPQLPPSTSKTNAGVADPNGIREFVVGTGGSNHTALTTPNAPNTQVTNATAFGVLQLTLHASSYDWKFVPVAGSTFTDSGSQACHKFVAGPDTTPPSPPSNVVAKAVASNEVDVSWSAASDASGIARYDVYRNGSKVGSATSTAYTDLAVAPSTPYTHCVVAYDGAGNASQTPPRGGSGGASVTADAYVVSGSSSNYGSTTVLRLDTSPATNSYLRFKVSGLSGPPSQATLRMYANSSLAAGFAVYAVSNDTWGEKTITFANAPSYGPLIAKTGAVASGSYASVDVSPYVTGNGDVDFALVGLSSTALSLGSRESTHPPQLVIAGGAGGTTTTDTTPPTTTIACNGGSCAGPFSSSVQISLNATDDGGGSGVEATYYTTDGSDPSASSNSGRTQYSGPFTVAATTTIAYSSVDADGNVESPHSATVTITSGGGGVGGGTVTLNPDADSYVNSASPSSNYGSASSFYVDADGVRQTYLTFDLSAVSGTITGATLRIHAGSSQSAGYQVFAVATTSWGEKTITWSNKPSFASTGSGSSGAVTSGSWTTVDLPPSLVQAALGGKLSLALTTTGNTNLRLDSRESASPPELVVATS